MKSFLLALFIFLTLYSSAQNADEINKKSVAFLDQKDVKSAFPFIKKAAELGHKEAQYNYGYFYQQGIEVEKNDSIANYWLLKSAEQGFVNAQFKMAYSYAVGRGTEKSPEKAFYWAKECAKQNDPVCISNLVLCYRDGFGTEKNADSVFAWTVRTACLPDLENLEMSGAITNARYTLAMKYINADGVPKDNVKGYMWLLIYNESKRDYSILDQSKNIQRIEGLEKQLTEKEIIQAKLDAEKQLKRSLKNLSNLYKQEY